ncbi:MAG TPA: FAD-dependent oxidoreductase, partial [Gaiellales bacterium]|nr:FAD-dependent oxidoreductase [Gaiellales bacterium]
MTGERVVVVGNGVSGFACAARLADAGVPVTMIGPGLPHDRPPLSKRALASGAVPWLADAAALAARRVDHLDGRVETINLKRRRLGVATAGAGDVEVAVDGPLVWATGLAPMPLEVPGGERAVSIATAAGMLAASAQLAEAGRSVVVIGAGLIGCEAAATLARRHRVWLLERGGRPVERLGPVVAGAVERALAAAGVTVLTGCRVGSVGTAAVETETHGSIAADVVIAAAGVDAALPLALAPAGSRSLEVDGRLRVAGADGVWACGDLAAFEHPRHGR